MHPTTHRAPSRIARLRPTAAALAALLLGVAPRLAAQDCATSPLLGGRVSAGVGLARSTDRVSAASASAELRLAHDLRLGGSYRATRLGDVDQLQHEGRAELSLPLSFVALDACPIVGGGYARLTTDRAGTQGEVTTRELRLGVALARTLPTRRAVRFTPFVQPMLVRRTVAWRSTSGAWVVRDDVRTTDGQLWLGLTLASTRNAVVARFLPSGAEHASELGVSIVRSFGRR